MAVDRPRSVNRATGSVVVPGHRYEWSGVLLDPGVGVWTRRQKTFDWSAAVRWRIYTQLFEGSPGGSFQATVGIVHPLGAR